MNHATEKMLKANLEAQGYIELALGLPQGDPNREVMRQRAIQALEKFLNDDDFVDQLYDEWYKDQKDERI